MRALKQKLLTLVIIGVFAPLLGCKKSPDTPLPYSMPAGELDRFPKSPYFYGGFDTAISEFDADIIILTPKYLDALASKLIGESISGFVSYSDGSSALSNYEWKSFYKEPKPSEIAGICEVDVFTISSFGKGVHNQASHKGEWSGKHYAIVGSIAPMPKPWPAEYNDKFAKACRARSDTWSWFEADNILTMAGDLRLLDQAVFAAKSDGMLPFPVTCKSFRGGQPEKQEDADAAAKCAGRVRYSLASIDPRAVTPRQIAASHQQKGDGQTIVDVSKEPKNPQTPWEEELWTVRINWSKSGGRDVRPIIASLEITDSEVIID